MIAGGAMRATMKLITTLVMEMEAMALMITMDRETTIQKGIVTTITTGLVCLRVNKPFSRNLHYYP